MIVLILYHCYYWHATKTVGPRMMPCRLEDADQHNLRTLVQLPKLILLCKPDPATRSASISEYKTSEFCPIKYHSTEVVHFDQSFRNKLHHRRKRPKMNEISDWGLQFIEKLLTC